MRLRIKVVPEDFVVEEIAAPALTAQGGYGLYRLEKQGLNTVDALRRLARELRLDYRRFSYGGKKDRHARTTQHITIKGCYEARRTGPDYALHYCGRTDAPMRPRLIDGNRFFLRVRGISPAAKDALGQRLGSMPAADIPNYFDDQRFGSLDRRQGFLAEKILKRQWNGALKLYLTGIHPSDSAAKRQRREFFYAHWRDWPGCAEQAHTAFERRAFDELRRDGSPGAMSRLLRLITHEELTLYYACYQSALWNEMLRRLMLARSGGRDCRYYAGRCGDYVFAAAEPGGVQPELIPAPGCKPVFATAAARRVYQEVLADAGLTQGMFNALRMRQAYFRSFPRAAWISVSEWRFCWLADDRYPGHQCLELAFVLPRGSYATMVVKYIFSTEK